MKNKKGFTIPELLAVIVILGILITISIGVYNGISKRLKENNLNTKIAYFKEKALEYASEENISDETISLNYLLKLGYVSAEYPENPERERIGNPLTGGFLDCMNFTITKDLDNYTATYDLEGSCDLVDQETTMEEISIEKYIKRDNTYIKITNEWVNEPVYLLVKFLNINKYQVIDDNFNYTIGGNETNKKGIYCSNLTDNDNPLENCYNVNIVDTNYIYNNNTDFSYTYPSIHQQEYGACMEKLKDQVDFPLLAESYPNDDPESILELICDVLCSASPTIRIGRESLPIGKVHDRFKRLRFEHVAYVLDSLRETTTRIINIKAYLLRALYDAPLTMGHFYAAAVRHDFA